MNSLSPSEQEAINEFVGIVGISLDSDETEQSAIRLLSHHNYNLNNSVLAFFETGLEVPTPDPPQASQFGLDSTNIASEFLPQNPNPLQSLQNDFGLELFLPKLAKAPRISNKWQFDLGIHMSKRAFDTSEKHEANTAESETKRPSFWWLLVLVFPKTLSLLYSAFRYFFGLDLVLNPHQKAIKNSFDFDLYDEDFAVSDSIGDAKNLYNLAYNDFNASHEAASQDFNFLLTVLIDNNSTQFLNQFLEQQLVKDLFNKSTGEFKDTVIYVSNIDMSPEGFEVSKEYKARKIPFIALLGNVSRDPSIMSSMSVIYKANCSMGDEEETETLLRKLGLNLQRHLVDYNPQLVTKRFDKQEIEFSRMIKEKQDAAYVESLNSDKIKKLEKANTLREKEIQERNIRIRKSFISHLSKTKYFEDKIKDASTKDLVRISIKLPNGKRIVHKFHKDAHMGELYLFVETKLNEEKEEENLNEPVEDMTCSGFIDAFTFPFELFKPFPKCTLPASSITIAEFGDLKSGDNVLFDYEEDSEDED